MLSNSLLRSFKSRLKQLRNKQQEQARQQKMKEARENAAQSLQQQADYVGAALSRSGRSVNQLYRAASTKALDLVVKTKVLGNIKPNIETASDETNQAEDALTFYVLKEYSRSNSLLVDLQARKHDLPAALQAVANVEAGINENAAIIFLHHPHAGDRKVSPRLARLVNAYRQNPTLKINLVPVSVLWGRAPDKEGSLFKLLMADNWEDPTIAKQLFNIGVMGRDTFVEFHPPQSLADTIQSISNDYIPSLSDSLNNDKPSTSKTSDAKPITIEERERETEESATEANVKDNSDIALLSPTSHALLTADEANFSLTLLIQQKLNIYLDSQRKRVIGPDLSDKRNLIEDLIHSPAIEYAIEQEVKNDDISVNEARSRAQGYAFEIVNDYNYSVIRSFYLFLNWLWTQLYDGVEVHNFERVKDLAADYELIYVPCHRSHVDYLLLAYIIFKHGVNLPYVAAGNNLDIPVLGPLLRSAIAFYIRRSFKDNDLYKAVLREYLHTLIQRNTPIEYFIEGGRSRSGRLLPPKLGMLSMTVHSQLRGSDKPLAFIPTYIGYERIMEGGTYVGELKGAPKKAESIVGLLKASRKIERIFGHVHVNFGEPLMIKDFMQKFEVLPSSLPADRTDTPLDDNTKAMVSNLSVKIMQNINKAAVVNPIALLAFVLLSAPKVALDEKRCCKQIALVQKFAKTVPYHDDTEVTDLAPKAIIDYAIKLKLVERTPHPLGDLIKVLPSQTAILSYFRNNILHVYILDSFIAALTARNGRIQRTQLIDIMTQMYPFLQSELFLYPALRTIPERIEKKLAAMIDAGLVVDLGDDILSTPETNSEPYQQLSMLASPVAQSLERYFMSLALLAQQGSGNLSASQVVDLCHLLGQRLSILYADDLPDSFDRALYTSFIEALIRLDYVQTDQDTGMLLFDERINNIAQNAHFVLSPDTMQILHNIADLDKAEIEHTIEEISRKKASKFRRKK